MASAIPLNAKSVTVTVSDPNVTSRYHRALILTGFLAHGFDSVTQRCDTNGGGVKSATIAEGQAMSHGPRCVIVIPAFNEASTVGAVVAALKEAVDYPIVVVDDASTDNTATEAKKAGARVLSLSIQLGAWGATQTGMRFAQSHGFDYVITMDADGQHLPEWVPKLVGAIQAAGSNVVIGACTSRGSRSRRVAWFLLRHMSGVRLEDLTSGFRIYDRAAIHLLGGWRANYLDYQDVGVLALLISKGLTVGDIQVPMLPRTNGGSKIFRSWGVVVYYMLHTAVLSLSKRNVSFSGLALAGKVRNP